MKKRMYTHVLLTLLTFTISQLFLAVLFTALANAQETTPAGRSARTVTGQVQDADGNALSGATVSLKSNSAVSTSTDAQGRFSLTVSGNAPVLVISFVGFKSAEVPVSTDAPVLVKMEMGQKATEEIVIVGYGTTKKVNLTGAVDVVKADRLENRPIVSAGEGLQGLAPNLNVTVTSGDATKGVDFNIRGFESINGGAPLILVDNVPMDLNQINPEDIKSVTVLKDGAASAIYGARAAFGVILVETKSGRRGTDIRVSSQFSWNKPIWHVNPIENGYEYALERNRIDNRDGRTPTYNADYLEGLRKYYEDPANNPAYELINGTFQNYAYNNMANTLMGTYSPRQKYDLSISGAADRASYYTSFGYLNTDGYLNHPANDNFKRYNVLLKGDYKIKDWISLDQQITINMQRSDKPAAADINTIIRNEPIRPHAVPRIPGYEQYEGKYWNHALMIYPQLQDGGRERFSTSDLWLKSGLTVKPFKGFTVRSDFSYNTYNREYENAQPAFQVISYTLNQTNPVETFGDDRIEVSRQFNQYYVFNTYAEYVVPKLKNHYLKGMVGYNQEWDYNTSISGNARTFISPNVVDISATSGLQQISGGKSHATLQGLFYRLNYNYKERYLIEANGRYDGTSRFPKKDRFGFFPSFSAGWRISEEAFMEPIRHVISNLKIRASYGSLGNQLLGSNYYPYISAMNAGFSNYIMGSGQIPVIYMPGLVSPTLTWEKVVSRNLGLDLVLFNGKLESFFEVYTRDTKDMLMRKDYPDVLGTGSPQENAADLRTKGWEASVKWRDRVSKNLNYYVDFNLSDWTSKITKYDNPTGALSEYYVGQTLGEIWGYQTVGIIQNQEQLSKMANQDRLGNGWMIGDIQFADLDGDGIISQGENTISNPGDRRVIGNNNPRYSFGLNSGVQFKGFFLDVFFQGIGKRDYMPSRSDWTWFYPWRSYNGDKSWLTDTWREDNPDAYFPASSIGTRNFPPQTRYLQNASYIRLKNLTIGYELPKAMLKRIGLSTMKVFVGGQNLWEYSNIRKPLDPEYIFSSSINYPLFRSYTFGLNLNL